MKKYTQTYLDGMGFDETSFVPCEVCGHEAVDIHHISTRGMGGTKKEDTIEGLMALCRTCHIKYGDKNKYMKYLITMHTLSVDSRYIDIRLKQYE